jgi:hypothetical protein
MKMGFPDDVLPAQDKLLRALLAESDGRPEIECELLARLLADYCMNQFGPDREAARAWYDGLMRDVERRLSPATAAPRVW